MERDSRALSEALERNDDESDTAARIATLRMRYWQRALDAIDRDETVASVTPKSAQ